LSFAYWQAGLIAFYNETLVPTIYLIIAVLVLLYLAGFATPTSIRNLCVTGWSRATGSSWLKYVAGALVLLTAGSVFLLYRESVLTPEHIDYSRIKLIAPVESASPLTEPTTFLYVDNAAIETLYGQYEPDLILASAKSAMEDSTEIKAGMSIENFLHTEIGRKVLAQKELEYKLIDKKPERKLKELLPYLYAKKLVHQFDNQLSSSDEVKNLDTAVGLFKQHDISVDSRKLATVRDRLLSRQVDKLEEDLRQLQGLVLIQGDWIVQSVSDQYRFTRPFVDNISHSAIAEFQVSKAQFSKGHRKIIDSLGTRTLRLRLFGNVLTGLSNSTRAVTVNPTALFQ
jgi:hypothetical protein